MTPSPNAPELDALDARLASVEARIAETEGRLAAAEDELAILRILGAYSPRVDSGDAEGVAELWTEDGVYDVDTGRLDGHEGLVEMVRGDVDAPDRGWRVVLRTARAVTDDGEGRALLARSREG